MFTLLETSNPLFALYAEVRSSSSLTHLRSAVLTEWYNRSSDQDIFVFIDNDQTFLPKDFFRLVSCESDVCGGLYRIHGADFPNCQFLKGTNGLQAFLAGETQEVLSIATGFMAIKRPILTKIIDYLQVQKGYSFVEAYGIGVVPFFDQTKVMMDDTQKHREWLGEDWSFCELVRAVGGKLEAFYSPTIGHDKMQVLYLNEKFKPRNQ